MRTANAFVRSLFALAFVSAIAIPSAAEAQRDFSDVQIEATHVAGPIYMLVGQGGNIGVSSGPDGTVMVDDQFAPLADKIRQALRDIGQSAEAAEPKFLLNTHFHGDHTGGNAEFGDASTIIAHSNVRQRLATEQNRNGQVTPAAPAEALPVITFDSSLKVHMNGDEILAIHIPRAHTDGDAVIHFIDSNVVHMGDLFFVGRFPFVDIAGGGSVEGLQAGIELALEEIPADAQIIPGHGPLSTIDDLREYKGMLDATIGLVQGQMDSGRSMEEIVGGGLGEEWAEWGAGFINEQRWIETIYQSLSGENDADYSVDVDPDHGAGDHSHPHTHGTSGHGH